MAHLKTAMPQALNQKWASLNLKKNQFEVELTGATFN
jgi:hypothetical protein